MDNFYQWVILLYKLFGEMTHFGQKGELVDTPRRKGGSFSFLIQLINHYFRKFYIPNNTNCHKYGQEHILDKAGHLIYTDAVAPLYCLMVCILI